MLSITGTHVSLHIIQFPSGRFGYVGPIRTDLGDKVPAERAAVLGRRSFRDPKTGCSMMWTFPSFGTVEGAIAHAKEHDHSPMWKNEAQ